MAGTEELAAEIRHQQFLVVESNAALQKAIVKCLTAAGVKSCETEKDGEAALRTWKEGGPFGVVISSWQLPKTSGLDLLKRIRADREAEIQPAFIIMSSEGTPEAVQEAAKEGADRFVVKPFSPENLVQLVVEGVERRKQIGGREVFARNAIATRKVTSGLEAELVYQRAKIAVECEELQAAKSVIRTDQNYGLGTVLTIRFRRPGGGSQDFYEPIKGFVAKMERVPGMPGMYRVHLEFRDHVKAGQGVRELLLADESDEPPP